MGKEEVGGELKRGKRNDEGLKERGRDRVEWGAGEFVGYEPLDQMDGRD